jgi:hypothetical protein
MKYFDINVKVRKARPHNRLRGLRKRLHDIYIVPKPLIKTGYMGEFAGFKIYVSNNLPEGFVYTKTERFFDRVRYFLGL